MLGSPDVRFKQFYCSGYRTVKALQFKCLGLDPSHRRVPSTSQDRVQLPTRRRTCLGKARRKGKTLEEKHCHLSINLQWCLGTKGPLQLSGPLNGQLSTCGHLREREKNSSTLQPCTWAFQQHYSLIVGMGPSPSPCWNRHLLGFKWITLYNERDYCLIAKSIPC